MNSSTPLKIVKAAAKLWGSHPPKCFVSWQDRRAIVFIRDKGLCAYCGEQAEHIDHIIPKSKGGTNSLSNLVATCSYCNLSKSDKNWLEWFLQQDFFDRRRAAHISKLLNHEIHHISFERTD